VILEPRRDYAAAQGPYAAALKAGEEIVTDPYVYEAEHAGTDRVSVGPSAAKERSSAPSAWTCRPVLQAAIADPPAGRAGARSTARPGGGRLRGRARSRQRFDEAERRAPADLAADKALARVGMTLSAGSTSSGLSFRSTSALRQTWT
jgi:hypothetical protein